MNFIIFLRLQQFHKSGTSNFLLFPFKKSHSVWYGWLPSNVCKRYKKKVFSFRNNFFDLFFLFVDNFLYKIFFQPLITLPSCFFSVRLLSNMQTQILLLFYNSCKIGIGFNPKLHLSFLHAFTALLACMVSFWDSLPWL